MSCNFIFIFFMMLTLTVDTVIWVCIMPLSVNMVMWILAGAISPVIVNVYTNGCYRASTVIYNYYTCNTPVHAIDDSE